MGVAQDLEGNGRKVGTQRGKGRQRQDKVADGSSANDQDPAFAFAHFDYFAFLNSITFAGRSATMTRQPHGPHNSTKHGKSEDRDKSAKRQAQSAQRPDALLAGRCPSDPIAQSPGGNGEPHPQRHP